MICDFHRLQNQVQVTFQNSGITDNQAHIAWLKAHIISCNLLLTGVCKQGVGSRKIYHLILAIPMCIVSLRKLHRFPRPVTGMLIHAGKLIEYRAFTDIGISKQSNGISLALLQVHFIDIVVRLNELFKQHMQPPSLLPESAHCLHCVKRFYSP